MAKALLSDKKKFLSTALVVGEVVLIACLLTISLIAMFATEIEPTVTGFMKFILWLQNNTPWMFILIVLPLIVLFLLNVYFLVKAIYGEKAKKSPVLSREELLEEAKRQAREEVLKEMEEAKKKEGSK